MIGKLKYKREEDKITILELNIEIDLKLLLDFLLNLKQDNGIHMLIFTL